MRKETGSHVEEGTEENLTGRVSSLGLPQELSTGSLTLQGFGCRMRRRCKLPTSGKT
jgi:hypothetical protein